MKAACGLALAGALVFTLAGSASAQESHYFITYDHHMEEPDNLEISANGTLGLPKGGNNFLGSWVEFEYGAKGWWTWGLTHDSYRSLTRFGVSYEITSFGRRLRSLFH